MSVEVVPKRQRVISFDTGWANCSFAEVKYLLDTRRTLATADGAETEETKHLELVRWSSTGISDERCGQRCPSSAPDDSGVEVSAIRQTWLWLHDKFGDLGASFNDEGVVLIERVCGVGVYNAVCLRVADVIMAFFQRNYPGCGIRMFAPNTRIAFTKKLVVSAAAAKPKTTARYNENKQRSVEAMDLLIDSSTDMWKLYKWNKLSRAGKFKGIRNIICQVPPPLEHKYRGSDKKDDYAEALLQALCWASTV
jgi:hypothetical protein